MDSGNKIANLDVWTVSDYTDEPCNLPKFNSNSFLCFSLAIETWFIGTLDRDHFRSHYATFHRCISGSFQTGESAVMTSKQEMMGRGFFPPLKSHSTQVFMLAFPRIVDGLLLSQVQLTGIFNWELVLVGLLWSCGISNRCEVGNKQSEQNEKSPGMKLSLLKV